MANPIHNLFENLEETLNSFKNILSIILRNQRHLELSQMQMINVQERHFDAIRWMISSLHKDDNEAHPPVSLTNDNENWVQLKQTLYLEKKDGWKFLVTFDFILLLCLILLLE